MAGKLRLSQTGCDHYTRVWGIRAYMKLPLLYIGLSNMNQTQTSVSADF